MKFTILLLLVGCATTDLDDLYYELALCANANGDCDELQKRIDRKEELIILRRNTEMPCPKGYIAYCDERYRGCGKKFSTYQIEYACVTRRQIRDSQVILR